MEKEIENLKERERECKVFLSLTNKNEHTHAIIKNQFAIMQSLIAIMQKLDKIETK